MKVLRRVGFQVSQRLLVFLQFVHDKIVTWNWKALKIHALSKRLIGYPRHRGSLDMAVKGESSSQILFWIK